MHLIEAASTATLCGLVTDVVTPGAVVHTDGWNGAPKSAPMWGVT